MPEMNENKCVSEMIQGVAVIHSHNLVSQNILQTNNLRNNEDDIPYFIKYRNYKNYSSRRDSFVGWPVTNKPSVEKLARAGFFYTGSLDKVICFCCGGGLEEWEENDNPWEEHMKYFRTCEFLQENKQHLNNMNFAVDSNNDSLRNDNTEIIQNNLCINLIVKKMS